MNRLLLSISLIALYHLSVSCDAPHINPLDPSNPDYKYGNIDGYVYSSTSEALEGVKVTWKNKNVIATTDSKGYYKIADVERINGEAYFERDGFEKDTLEVDWGNLKNKTLENRYLNYTIGYIDGYVYSNNGPALAGVKVIWKNQNIFTTTDSKGYYKINGITRITGIVEFEKDGYAKESSIVNWGNLQNLRLSDKVLGYTIGVLDGYVFSNPQIAAEGVRVIWKNQNVITYTNSTGYYKIKNIKTEEGKLLFEKTGLIKDSINVSWDERDSVRVQDHKMYYNIGNLSGTVYKYPNDRAAGVKVTWENQGISTLTNSNGNFTINNLPMDDGKIFFEKEGLKSASIDVRWAKESDLYNAGTITLNYSAGTLRGTVLETGSGIAISSVQVLWKNLNQVTHTGTDGKYSFTNVPYADGMLYFQKEGYYKDSIFVEFTSLGNEQPVQSRSLKFIPVLDSINISTTVKYDFTVPTYSVYIFARIKDPSQRISLGQVYVKGATLNLNQRLDLKTGYYDLTYNFGQKNISEALGKDFIITGKDDTSKEFTIGKTKLTRVIDKEITVRSPLNSEVVSSQPTLNWDRFLPGFNFRYSIQIYDETTSSTILAWQNDNVSQDEIAITPEFMLSSGKYFWFITCIDQYGNQSISKRYKFVVQ